MLVIVKKMYTLKFDHSKNMSYVLYTLHSNWGPERFHSSNQFSFSVRFKFGMQMFMPHAIAFKSGDSGGVFHQLRLFALRWRVYSK